MSHGQAPFQGTFIDPFGGINSKVSCKLYVSIANAHTDGKDLWPFKNLRQDLFQFTPLPAVMRGQLPMSSPILGFTNLFHFSHSAGWVVASYCVFNFHFPGDKGYQTLFMCWLSTWIYFFGKSLFFGPFLMELSVFSTIYKTHTYTDLYIHDLCILTACCLPFHFLMVLLINRSSFQFSSPILHLVFWIPI